MKFPAWRLSSALFAFTLNLFSVNGAAAFKWTGAMQPGKYTTPKTGKVTTGEFGNLATNEEWGHVIYNIRSRYPASIPWILWGVGPDWPGHKTPLTDAQHEAALSYLDRIGVDVYLDSRNCGEPVAFLDAQMKKFGKHKCVKGFGFDLEFFQGGCGHNGAVVSDAVAKALDEKLKSFNPNHRLFFKHWAAANMPKTYRGKGDLIFICTASERSPESLWKSGADFCNAFAPGGVPTAACGAQIGYPADEPLGDNHTYNGPYDGWSKFKDPIKEWGDAYLAGITSKTQEVGIDWVTYRSERIPWDLTKGAIIPASAADYGVGGAGLLRAPRNGSILSLGRGHGRLERNSSPITDLVGCRIPSQSIGVAAGRYFLKAGRGDQKRKVSPSLQFRDTIGH